MEENVFGKTVSFQISPDEGKTWIKCESYEALCEYIWNNQFQKKKTFNMKKRLAAKAIIYSSIHN